MEVKILCECGSKFAFDVEPVGGALPYEVYCPTCERDVTAQGNDFIAAQAPPPAPSGRVGLKVRAAEHPSAPAPTSQPDPVIAAASESSIPKPAKNPVKKAPARAGIPWKAIGSGIVTVVCVIFLIFTVGKKWYRRFSAVAGAFSSESSGDDYASDESNFSFEDAVFIYTKTQDTDAVAKAVQEYLTQSLKKQVAATKISEDFVEGFGPNDWIVYPAHNGYVQLYSGLKTSRENYLGLAKALSQKFNNTTMLYRDVDFTGEFHFAVIEAGVQQMDGEMKLVGTNLRDATEKITMTGKDWAKAHGYKEDDPKDEDYMEFHWGHANDISKGLGLKLWDQDYEEQLAMIFLNVP